MNDALSGSRRVRTTLLAAFLMSMAAPAAAAPAASESPWLGRVTGIVVFADANSDNLDLSVPDMVDLAFDVSYFFSANLSVNVLATILRPEVKAGGDSLGNVGLVPPIVTVQYHFQPGPTSFYVGAGFNYNYFYDESGGLDALDAEVDDAIGWVAQVGMDFELTENTVMNLDLKYLSLSTDVDVAGDKADELDLDAIIVGIGLGWRL